MYYKLNCLSKFVCWIPNPLYFRMWPYLEIESLQKESSENEITRVSPDPTWQVCLQKRGGEDLNIERHTEREGDVKRRREKAAIYKPETEAWNGPPQPSEGATVLWCFVWLSQQTDKMARTRTLEPVLKGDWLCKATLSQQSLWSQVVYWFAWAAITKHHT